MSSSLGFKLSVAGGGTAATASAAAGGLYLSSGESISTNDSLDKNTIDKPKQSSENLKTKEPSPQRNLEQKQIPRITPVRNVYSKIGTSSNLGPDTIGGRYYFFLAGTTIDPNVDVSTKDSYIEWWKQKFDLWKTDVDNKKDTQFKGITQGYSDKDNKALNKVCEEVYKKDDPFDPKIKSITRTVENLEHNYWRYCSDLDEKPKSLVETNEYNSDDNSKVGHYDGYGHVLAALGEKHNNQFWKLKQSWYESLTEETGKIDNNFKTYAESKSEAKENGKVSLRKVCKIIKDLDRESGLGDLTPQVIVKYCGFSEHLYKPDSTQD